MRPSEPRQRPENEPVRLTRSGGRGSTHERSAGHGRKAELNEVPVPVSLRVDRKGRVVYNCLLELMVINSSLVMH